MEESCCGNMVLSETGGVVCTGCGLMFDNYIRFVPEYDPNAWTKKKSVHKRNKWFAKRLFGVVDYKHIDTLVCDFIQVVNQLANNGLIRRNVSKYGYYIIRLAERNGVKLKNKINDIKPGRTKEMFDDNLFGVVYPSLGFQLRVTEKHHSEWVCKKVVKLFTVKDQEMVSKALRVLIEFPMYLATHNGFV